MSKAFLIVSSGGKGQLRYNLIIKLIYRLQMINIKHYIAFTNIALY